jgi:CRP/FNR family cyclic AMP-dependent transcriptional regulator
MIGRAFSGGWPFAPVPARRGRISREELAQRELALTQAALFSGMPKRHLRAIARVTGTTYYPPGDAIVKQGSTGSYFYVILEGAAKVVRNGRTVAKLGAGDFFGEVSLLDPGPRTASVVTEAPSYCLRLAGPDLRRILSRESALAMQVMRELAHRLRQQGPLE